MQESLFKEFELEAPAGAVIEKSAALARLYGNQRIHLNHLFLAFLEQQTTLEACVNDAVQALLRLLGTREEWVEALPRIRIHLANAAPLRAIEEPPPEPQLSPELLTVLRRARSMAKLLGDPKIAGKHLLLSLFSNELRQFRERFLAMGSASVVEDAQRTAKSIVESAREDAARILQNAHQEARREQEHAHLEELQPESTEQTKTEILSLVSKGAEGWTLSELGHSLGVAWQSLIRPCRQLVQEGRLLKQGKVYLFPKSLSAD